MQYEATEATLGGLRVPSQPTLWRPEGEQRDVEIVRWLGRLGAAEIGHLGRRFRMPRTSCYRRVHALIEAHLVERIQTFAGQPSLLRASRRGLRYAELALTPAKVTPDLVSHWSRCADVAILLEEEAGAMALLTEREIRVIERLEGKPLASARVRDNYAGRTWFHRPDLAMRRDGSLIAIEVELTAKAPTRLDSILRGWRRSTWVSEVRYYVAGEWTRRGLERSLKATRAEEKVRIIELPATAGVSVEHREDTGN